MGWLKNLDDEQLLLFKFWLPALANGLLVWIFFLTLGETPLLRASGLALVIVGVTLALRRMGSAVAMIGGLCLALSPAFWSQTGGSSGEPATIVIALAVAGATVLLVILLSKRPAIGLGLGVVVFAILFWSQIGTPRSIRLTGFIIAWLMYLLIDMLLLTNPRPEDAPLILGSGGLKTVDGAVSARPYHIFGILLLITLGILNDPLVTLLMPTVVLSLLLTNSKLQWWYWLAIGIVIGLGLYGIWNNYMVEESRFLMLGNWRSGAGWVEMIRLLIRQFTIVGLVLSLLGLARLARWYAPLGIVSMIGFGAYWIFGIIYTGPRQDILLLPMYIIFVLWMSYAVLAISEWASRTFAGQPRIGRYFVIASYAVLPAIMLFRILTA